jgi:hypothetical protein
MKLFTGSVPENKNYVEGTVPSNINYVTGTAKKSKFCKYFPQLPTLGLCGQPIKEFCPKLHQKVQGRKA